MGNKGAKEINSAAVQQYWKKYSNSEDGKGVLEFEQAKAFLKDFAQSINIPYSEEDSEQIISVCSQDKKHLDYYEFVLLFAQEAYLNDQIKLTQSVQLQIPDEISNELSKPIRRRKRKKLLRLFKKQRKTLPLYISHEKVNEKREEMESKEKLKVDEKIEIVENEEKVEDKDKNDGKDKDEKDEKSEKSEKDETVDLASSVDDFEPFIEAEYLTPTYFTDKINEPGIDVHFSVDFDRDLPKLVRFLNRISRCKEYFKNSALLNISLNRYEIFLQIVADIANSKKGEIISFCPPLDVAIVWFIHLLTRSNYKTDCFELFGTNFVCNYFFLSKEEKKESRERSKEIWKKLIEELELSYDKTYSYNYAKFFSFYRFKRQRNRNIAKINPIKDNIEMLEKKSINESTSINESSEECSIGDPENEDNVVTDIRVSGKIEIIVEEDDKKELNNSKESNQVELKSSKEIEIQSSNENKEPERKEEVKEELKEEITETNIKEETKEEGEEGGKEKCKEEIKEEIKEEEEKEVKEEIKEEITEVNVKEEIKEVKAEEKSIQKEEEEEVGDIKPKDKILEVVEFTDSEDDREGVNENEYGYEDEDEIEGDPEHHEIEVNIDTSIIQEVFDWLDELTKKGFESSSDYDLERLAKQHKNFFLTTTNTLPETPYHCLYWLCHFLHPREYKDDCLKYNQSLKSIPRFNIHKPIKHKFNYKGCNTDFSFGQLGEDNNGFNNPRFIIHHPYFYISEKYRNFYIADGKNARIKSVKENGAISQIIRSDTNNSIFSCVGFDYSSLIMFASDTKNNNIHIFTSKGKLIGKIGNDEQISFSTPTGIAVHYQTRKIFISDYVNDRIHIMQIIDPDEPSEIKQDKGEDKEKEIEQGEGEEKEKDQKLEFIGKTEYIEEKEEEKEKEKEKGEDKKPEFFGYSEYIDDETQKEEVKEVKNEEVKKEEEKKKEEIIFKFTYTEDDKEKKLWVRYVGVFGKNGNSPSYFIHPNGIQIQQQTGNIFVVDRGNHRIQIFDQNLMYLHQFGSGGKREGEFEEPNAIYVSELDGYSYVSDTNNDRIHVFDEYFQFVKTYEKPSFSLNRPYGLTAAYIANPNYLNDPTKRSFAVITTEFWGHKVHAMFVEPENSVN